MHKLTITLHDGTEHIFTVKRMPRFFGSWLHQQLPYGTDFYGSTVKRERV